MRLLLSTINNLKIRYKLMLSYFLVVVVSVTSIAVFSYQSSVSYIEDQSIMLMRQTMEQVKINLNNNLENYQYLMDTLYNNQDLQSYIMGNYLDAFDEYMTVNYYILPTISSVLTTTGKGVNLSLIRYGSNLHEIIQTDFDNIIKTSAVSQDLLKMGPRQYYQIYNIDRIEERDWFLSLKGRTQNYLWMQVENDERFNHISLLREMISFKHTGRDGIGLLKLTVRLEDLLDEDPYFPISENEFYLILDEEGRPLTVNDHKNAFYDMHMDLIQACAQREDGSSLIQDDMILLKSTMDTAGWQIISVNSIKTMKAKALQIRNMTLMAAFVSCLVLFAVTYKISSVFANRIIKILEHMKRFREGIEFEKPLKDLHQDELGYLAGAYNELMERIRTLIKDVYQANIDKKEAQLTVLQAQINPHFLYNSLSAISRLADKQDTPRINRMVRALTRFYRMTLNKGNDIISIGDELEQVKAYLEVYRIRMGEYFRVTYQMDPSMTSYYTIKVILQPFVENILEHGFYNRKGPVNIIIACTAAKDDIEFRITDDGIGMDRDLCTQLLSSQGNEHKGFGIKNVNDRIKLQFGENYGVSIHSRYGIGTTVIVLIPRFIP